MDTKALEDYIYGRRNQQKDARSYFKYPFHPGDYEHGFSHWAFAQAFQMFIEAVYEKALQARDKHGFPELGWATPDWEVSCRSSLAEHVQKGDPKDVAVLAMFCWFHGWSTALPTPDIEQELIRLLDALPMESIDSAQSVDRHTPDGIEAALRNLLQTNARLVEETHRWSAAVKKLEAERAATPAPLADAELAELSALITPHWQKLGDNYLYEALRSARKQCSHDEAEQRDTDAGLQYPSEDDAALLVASHNAVPGLLARIVEANNKAAQLQAFKDFVHETLDDAGVDKHEELNATSGCRVGGRLKDLIAVANVAFVARWAPEADERTRPGVSTRIALVPNTDYLSGWERKPAVWKGTYWQHSSFQSRVELDVRYILVEAEHPPLPPAP